MSDNTKKQIIPFSDVRIKNLVPPDKGRTTYYDSRTPGLCVLVSATGNKSFYVIKKRAGKTIWLHLGSYPTISAWTAQAMAIKTMAGFADPANDPQTIKRSLVTESQRAKNEKIERDAMADKISLSALCDAYAEHLALAEKQCAGNVRSLFAVHLATNNPKLAAKAAKEITREDANNLIKSVAVAHRRTANKLRSYLLAAYNLPLRADSDPNIQVELKQFGIDSNPLQFTKPLSGASKPGERSLTKVELFAYYSRLLTMRDGNIKDVLLLCLLLGGQRMSQVLRVTDKGFDSDNNRLEILDSKGRRVEPRIHVLPLSAAALEIVKRRALGGGALFASKGTVTNLETLSVAVAALSISMMENKEVATKFSLRDIRRTCETHLAELGVSKDIRAQLLSHGLTGVQVIHYDRHAYLAEKTEALAVWTKYLTAGVKQMAKSSKSKPTLTRI